MDIRTTIKNILSKTKTIGLSVLKKLKPVGIDVKSATKGFEELKSQEGFNKLPAERQRQLIEDYIKKIPLTKQ